MKQIKKSCDNCVFNMPNNNKQFVCAGREKEYGNPTPIENVNYNECWEGYPWDYPWDKE